MNKLRKGLKDISIAVSSNLLVTAVSITMSILAPLYLSVENYGYWQINVLYGGYVGFLHLGWIDGLYIKYVGHNYDELNKRDFQSQFIALFLFQLVVSLVGILSVKHFVYDVNKLIALSTVFVSSLLSIPRGMLLFILQASSRIKDYSIANCVGRIVSLIVCLCIFVFGKASYISLLISNFIGLLFSTLCSIYYCRDIIFCSRGHFKYRFSETIDDIKCGSKITLAYLTGNMVVGLVKAVVEMRWGLSNFGIVSFAVSISSIIMILINAIGTVILPIIKNTEQEKLGGVYSYVNKIMAYILPLSLLAYYPICVLVGKFLPKYAQGIELLAILFPICIFESKMGLCNNTFLKALRKENSLLIVNVLTVVLTAVLTYFFAYILNNYIVTISIMVMMIALRCIIADYILSRHLKTKTMLDDAIISLFTVIFIAVNSLFGIAYGMILFLLCLAIFMFIKVKDIKAEIVFFLNIFISKK